MSLAPVPLAIALAAVAVACIALMLRGRTAGLDKIEKAVDRLTAGEWSARAIVPGNGCPARLAEKVNGLAEYIQEERSRAAGRERVYKQLVTSISHDLRTPVTSIAGYLNAIQGADQRDSARYLAIATQKTEELAGLIEDLFYLARAESGELVLKIARIDLAEIMRQVLLSFEPQLKGRSLAVDVRLAETPCLIFGDAAALRRVFTNLIANALRHAEGATVFGVNLRVEKEEAIARIWDDGCGIQPKERENLFQRAFAGSPSSGGTGLGLAIADQLARKHGGKITVVSEPRVCTAFEVRLPVA